MQTKKIGIISLGLIGGSLFKKLADNKCKIKAVTRNIETIEKAKKINPNISNDIRTLKDCDIIFVCSPINKTTEILDALECIVNPNTIVTDVCSLKEFVTKKERPYIFIGSHPMAGTENNGYDASFKELFESATWVLTPTEKQKANHKEAIDLLKNIIQSTGAKTCEMDAKTHDETVALISHMPMLIAQALMKTTIKNNDAVKLAASGFRDMTRLAMSNTQMATDMINTNRENISKSLELLIAEAQNLLNSNYTEEIEIIKNFRKNMYNSEGKNISN